MAKLAILQVQIVPMVRGVISFSILILVDLNVIKSHLGTLW